MANFGAFVYMNARDIGLTIDTIPVISLGIGLGVDYGIYTVARIRDEVRRGAVVEDAVTAALKPTVSAVFSTFAVMVILISGPQVGCMFRVQSCLAGSPRSAW